MPRLPDRVPRTSGVEMHEWSRRDFLRLTGGGTLLLTVAGSGLLAACDPPRTLENPDANGVRLPRGFTSRVDRDDR